jgi:hypothetical protein
MNLKRTSMFISFALFTLTLAACGQKPQSIQPREIERWESSALMADQAVTLQEIAFDDGTVCSSFVNPTDSSSEQDCW